MILLDIILTTYLYPLALRTGAAVIIASTAHLMTFPLRRMARHPPTTCPTATTHRTPTPPTLRMAHPLPTGILLTILILRHHPTALIAPTAQTITRTLTPTSIYPTKRRKRKRSRRKCGTPSKRIVGATKKNAINASPTRTASIWLASSGEKRLRTAFTSASASAKHLTAISRSSHAPNPICSTANTLCSP